MRKFAYHAMNKLLINFLMIAAFGLLALPFALTMPEEARFSRAMEDINNFYDKPDSYNEKILDPWNNYYTRSDLANDNKFQYWSQGRLDTSGSFYCFIGKNTSFFSWYSNVISRYIYMRFASIFAVIIILNCFFISLINNWNRNKPPSIQKSQGGEQPI